jgi:Resolvase, N terminal domain
MPASAPTGTPSAPSWSIYAARYAPRSLGRGPTGASIPKMLKALVPGDVVTVTRIDRLARSTCDLFAIVKQNEGGQGLEIAIIA